jgi:hypothetical protein
VVLSSEAMWSPGMNLRVCQGLDYFRGVDIRKGIPMMFHTNIVLNGREIREPSGHVGEGRGHSAKTYVFVFFIA